MSHQPRKTLPGVDLIINHLRQQATPQTSSAIAQKFNTVARQDMFAYLKRLAAAGHIQREEDRERVCYKVPQSALGLIEVYARPLPPCSRSRVVARD
jgi:DNA-binding HxlR family transcriptional regulator